LSFPQAPIASIALVITITDTATVDIAATTITAAVTVNIFHLFILSKITFIWYKYYKVGRLNAVPGIDQMGMPPLMAAVEEYTSHQSA
jgi:hypothetical protein